MTLLSGTGKLTSWQAIVWDRLCQVEADLEQAVNARGWLLEAEADGTRRITDPTAQQAALVASAQAVVTRTFQFVGEACSCLRSGSGLVTAARERLTGELLMPAYGHLHAAEAQCVLLSSEDQLTAKLPSIRARAAAYLPVTHPLCIALDGLPDPAVPAHQALARLHREIVSKVPAPVPPVPVLPVPVPAGPVPPAPVPPAPVPPGPVPPVPVSPASAVQLTGMLGRDQQIAAAVLGAAFSAEDAQQAQVRRFRGVLFGTSAALFALVAILWFVVAGHPALINLCLRKQVAVGPLVCPSGGKAASSADLRLVLGLGAIGAALAVARNLAGLQRAGVRYSLAVAEGLVKIPFGAITAVLGILLLQTQADTHAALASQGGLLTAAVVFGYAQQLFTGLIDRRADSLMSAAAPTTAAATGTPGTGTVTGIR